MAATRDKLATVYHGMCSNMSKTSRGRRELCRKFVPLDIAPALFKTQPSHHCLFGGNSIDEAVRTALDATSINKDLVIMPKRVKLPFRKSGSGGKSWAWKNRSSTQKNYGKDKSNFSKGQRGKGKTRRGSRGRRKTKATTQK